jgi:hypothetical protein
MTGEVPTIDLVLGYHKKNKSPLLELFLSRVDELIARVSKRSGEPGSVPSAQGAQRREAPEAASRD